MSIKTSSEHQHFLLSICLGQQQIRLYSSYSIQWIHICAKLLIVWWSDCSTFFQPSTLVTSKYDLNGSTRYSKFNLTGFRTYDHYSTFHVPETPVLTTWPSETSFWMKCTAIWIDLLGACDNCVILCQVRGFDLKLHLLFKLVSNHCMDLQDTRYIAYVPVYGKQFIKLIVHAWICALPFCDVI